MISAKKTAQGLATWHALIAQELERLGEPNTTPTEAEIDATNNIGGK